MQVISKADRQLPEEVYRAAADAEAAEGQSQGRSERKRRRAAVKRSFKKAKEDQVRAYTTTYSQTPGQLMYCIGLSVGGIDKRGCKQHPIAFVQRTRLSVSDIEGEVSIHI